MALVQTEERICFDIPTVDDDVVEPSESIVVRLSNPERVTIGNAQVEIFITNDGDCKCVTDCHTFNVRYYV